MGSPTRVGVFGADREAEEVRDRILALQKEYLIELADAVIAVKDDKGRVKLNQMVNMTAAGALSGAIWGTLVGMIFLAPLVGTARHGNIRGSFSGPCPGPDARGSSP